MAEKTCSIDLDPGTGSILVIRLKAMGDILLSIPLISSLRRTFPEARIDYLCLSGYGEAIGGNADIDNVIEFEKGFFSQLSVMLKLRRARYDLVIDLISSPRSALITLFTGGGLRVGMDVGRHGFCYHRLLPRTVTRDGRKVKLYTMDFNREVAGMLNLKRDPIPGSGSRYQTGFEAAPSDHRWAEEFLSGKDRGEGFIGLVPGAKYQAKNFPAEKFLEFISIVTAETGYRPVIIWGPGEERIADYIAGSSPEALKPPLTGISRLGALISRLQCVVGVDSGPKHLAVIQGIPTVTIFGPTDPEVWDPMTERHRVVRSNLNCSPCGLTECSDVSCMKRIEAGELFKEMKKAVRCNDPKRGIE